MFVLASPIVDWNAMWKICVVALAAGAGVVVAFGFLLLGLKLANRARTDGTQSTGSRLGGYTLSAVCGVICIGVVVIGVDAMTKKTPSKPAKTKSALVIPAGPRMKLIASTRGATAPRTLETGGANRRISRG
jgi:heme/copper-type cytochrome/quinol oxidase subunit 2